MSDHEDLPEDRAALTRDDLQPTRRSLPLSNETVGLVVVAALGVLMIGFILGRVTAPDEESPTATPTAPGGTLAPTFDFPGGDVDRAGYWGFAQITAVVVDSFDRDDGALGQADTGGEWESVEGRWRIDGGRASVEGSDDDRPRIAVIAGNTTSELTEVTLMTSEDGAGLVFRYRNPRNFWSVTADEDGASWTVTKVIDGQIALTETVPAPSGDGSTIAVSQRPARLLFLVEGVIKHQINDTGLSEESTSGLIALPGTGDDARWDRFFVGNLPPEG